MRLNILCVLSISWFCVMNPLTFEHQESEYSGHKVSSVMYEKCHSHYLCTQQCKFRIELGENESGPFVIRVISVAHHINTSTNVLLTDFELTNWYVRTLLVFIWQVLIGNIPLLIWNSPPIDRWISYWTFVSGLITQ